MQPALFRSVLLISIFVCAGSRSRAQTAVPILVYHRFGAVQRDAMTVTTEHFGQQMELLRKNHYRVIPLEEIIAWRLGKAPAPVAGSVALTFDDGHRSVFDEARPIVLNDHLPVTLFIYPSCISRASYSMTWEQISELTASGFFIAQSHTYWHPNFKRESAGQSASAYSGFVNFQLRQSKVALEDRLKCPVDFIAWPFGIYDAFLMEEARALGYRAGFSIECRAATDVDPIMAMRDVSFPTMKPGRGFFSFCNPQCGGRGMEVLSRRIKPMTCQAGCIAVLIAACPILAAAAVVHGRVVDSVSHQPVRGAWVVSGPEVRRTDSQGRFDLPDGNGPVSVRAIGYSRAQAASCPDLTIALSRLRVRGLYLSFWGVSSTVLREGVLETAARAQLNTLVIDAKGDRSFVSYPSQCQLAREIGANRIITIRDLPRLTADLHRRGFYTIGRIVVFKDDNLARARPELAVKTSDGASFEDREKLRWTDPFNQTVWNYNIDLAVEAARQGFDEIEFDYVRFPDQKGLQFSKPSTETNRREAIVGFLSEAMKRLAPYNVFLSADNFGYVCWNLDDTGIGQCIGDIGSVVDYVSPMLYPSSFQFGIPGTRNPLSDPYRIVFASLQRARERTRFPAEVFRPWLQAFDDYAFDRRVFGINELRAQIKAAQDANASGWLLWDPKNNYQTDILAQLARELWLPATQSPEAGHP